MSNKDSFWFCPEGISRNIFYPLWDVWDRSTKLEEMKSLQKSQWLSLDELKLLQAAKFAKLLKYAEANSPYYKRLFKVHEINVNSVIADANINAIPITTKKEIRNNKDELISSEYKKSDLINAKTGGSTGFSLELYFDKTCQELRNAAAMRTDIWAGWNPGKLRGDLWGNPKLPTTLKQKIRNSLLDKVIYLDTMDLTHKSMSRFIDRANQYGVEVIFGHAHSIYLLAKFIQDECIEPPKLKGAISTSMMLLDAEREIIEAAFSCKVTNRYGCEEVGLIASECEQHDALHINMEHVLVEVVDSDGNPVQEGETGKILVTDLNNYAMPLIRYQVEDMAVFTESHCKCGRGLPLLKSLSGRVADFLKREDGSSVAGISLIERTLTKVQGVEQMQIVQKGLLDIQINRVKGDDFSETTDSELRSEFVEVFGKNVKFSINDVEGIPQEANGKYRFSICQL
jgi:phenylacetate-coenzyme A ligase PaaK-like adenylate-forming protein